VLENVINEWSSGIPHLLWWTLLVGYTLSLIPNRLTNKKHFPIALLFIPYILTMVFIQRPYHIARIWIWIFPLFILWSTGTLTTLLDWAIKKSSRSTIIHGVASILIFAFAINSINVIQQGSQDNRFVEDPSVEHVTSFLKDRSSDNDLVVVSYCSSPRYWYYFLISDIPDNVIRKKNRAFEDIYVIVYSESNPSCKSETLENVLEKNGPNIEFLNLDEIELVFEYQYADVYMIGTYPTKIQDAFSTNN
jgi:hypothetical protein